NILYNTVPLSLHGQLDSIMKKNCNILRMDFSVENETETSAVTEYYLNLIADTGRMPAFPYKEFTNGHYRRGVE
ncbi:MAG: hypothetical protein K2M91_00415, partial [Lachnospiraceae bacterium]|nr:hypothetical protein [Lachnospiraceae bacterium]